MVLHLKPGTKLLLVESDQERAKEYTRNLGAQPGITITHSTSRKEALALIKANPKRFDQIVVSGVGLNPRDALKSLKPE